MKQWRTISKAFEEIKTCDPRTSITLGFLRDIVREGQIPSKKIGNRYMLCLSDVEAFLIDSDDYDKKASKAEYIRSKAGRR